MMSRAPGAAVFFYLILAHASTLGVATGLAGDERVAGEEPGPEQHEILTLLDRPRLSRTELRRIAELANPEIAAARHAVAALAGRTRQVGLHPNPTLELEVEEMWLDDPSDRKDKLVLGVPLVVSGRLGAAVDAASAEHGAAAHALERTRREVLRRVDGIWVEQLHIRDVTTALDELQQVAGHTLEIARTRFAARAAPESQVTRALIEVYELEMARRQLEHERVRTAAELRALLGGWDIASDRLEGTLETDDVGLERAAGIGSTTDDHPAVLAARRYVEAAGSALRAARRERLPDLDLFVAYGRHRGTDEGFVEAGVAVTLPVFDRNQGRIAERHALHAEATEHARTVEDELIVRQATASQRYRSLREQLELSRDRLLPAAERGLDQAREGYRAGRLQFLELLDAQRTLAQIRLRTLELARDRALAGAELMSLFGTPAGATRTSREEDSP